MTKEQHREKEREQDQEHSDAGVPDGETCGACGRSGTQSGTGDGPGSPEEQTVSLASYQRLQADFDNYRRRSRQESRERLCQGREEVIRDLLAVLDNFHRALGTDGAGGYGEFGKGMQLIYRQLGEVLQQHGLAPIEAAGCVFDPEYHDAIMQEETDCPDRDGVVLEDMQTGYTVEGKVIRPSMVTVGKYCGDASEKTKGGKQ